MQVLQQSSISDQTFDFRQSSSILPKDAAIAFSVVGVALLALPVLVVLQILSSLYWGVVTIYSTVGGGDFNLDRELQSYNTRSWDT